MTSLIQSGPYTGRPLHHAMSFLRCGTALPWRPWTTHGHLIRPAKPYAIGDRGEIVCAMCAGLVKIGEAA